MDTTLNVGTPAPGADGQPVQPVSGGEAKPIDGDTIRLLTELGGKFTTLEKELRGLQGRQDKNEKTVGGFQEQFARFNQIKTQGNLTDEQAMAEINRIDLFTTWQTNLEQKIDALAGRLGGIGTTPTEQQMVAEVLTEFKLDPKDTFVASQLQGKQFANRTEAEAFAGRVLRDKLSAPSPNPALGATLPGQPAPTGSTNQAELWAQYQAEVTPHRGNVLAVSDIQSKYRKLGLQV